jgi:DNA polymerase-4
MDAFFASVEQHDHPELRGKPVVVGAAPDQRGVVSAASYEARTFGIHSAMPSSEAGRRCPHAVFVPVNGKRYREVSKQVFAIFERFTPLVEPLSIDEAFLDVSGATRLFGGPVEIARRLKAAIRDETGLTASVGVAHNKFLAKLASDMEKPDGLTVVPEQREELRRFLAPLSVGRIWGVGNVTRQALAGRGIRTIGDLQVTPLERLAGVVGRHNARHLLRLAWGEDAREIELTREEKSMSREHTFLQDCADPDVVREVLHELVEDVAGRLREAHRYGCVAHLKLRWADFQTITRQRKLARPACDDFSLRRAAEELLEEQEMRQPVRLVGFGVSRLVDQAVEQLSLFDVDPQTSRREESLSRTVDRIRARHGKDSIGRARPRPRDHGKSTNGSGRS